MGNHEGKSGDDLQDAPMIWKSYGECLKVDGFSILDSQLNTQFGKEDEDMGGDCVSDVHGKSS